MSVLNVRRLFLTVAALLVARGADARSIAVRAQPDQVVLGVDKRVVIEMDAGGTLKGLPRANATAGTVHAVEPLGGGRFRALYEPPGPGSPPQVALIAVWDSGDVGTLGHVAIPIVANLTMQLESAPGATVVVSVGDNTSSPATANQKGEVTVTVRVPPGHRKARIATTYANGRRTTTEEALDVPTWNRVRLVVGATEVAADGRAVVPVRVVAVTTGGRPTTAGLSVGANLGRVTNVRREGAYLAAMYDPRIRGSAATDTIFANLAGDGRSVDRRSIELRPVELRDFTVSERVERKASLNGEIELVVTATLRSRAMVGVPGERVVFSPEPDLGRPKRQRDIGRGRYEAVFSIPKEREDEIRKRGKVLVKVSHAPQRGRSSVPIAEAEFAPERLGFVTAVATVTRVETITRPDGSKVEVKVEVPVEGPSVTPLPEPETPVEVSIHLDPETIRADGGTSRIVVHVFDDDGRAVTGKALKVVASAGAVKRVVEQGKGFYVAEYEAPTIVDRTRTEFPVNIRVTSADHSVSYREAIAIEASLASDFPPPEKKFRLGAMAGGWLPFGTAFGVAVDIDFTWRLPILDRNLHLLAVSGAYFPQDSTSVTGGSVAQRQRIFPIAVGLLYRRSVGKPWFSLFAGVAGGVYVVDEEVSAFGQKTTQTSVLVGFQAPFGLEFRLGPGAIPLSARFHQTILRQGGSEGSGVTGTVQAFTVTTGYRVEF